MPIALRPRTNTLVAATMALALALVISACDSSPESGAEPTSHSAGTISADSDALITSRVSTRFATERRLRNSQISVSSSGGTVTLTGVVADADTSADAEAAARSVAGVQEVINHLVVPDGGMNSPATRELVAIAQQAVADTGISTRVRSELRSDTLLKDARVSVETRLGVVTLTGTVPSPAAVDRARSIARRVEGVRRVDVTALVPSSR